MDTDQLLMLTVYIWQILIETARELGLEFHSKGTNVTIEGPRFSSRAESLVWRMMGGTIINMTTVPEVGTVDRRRFSAVSSLLPSVRMSYCAVTVHSNLHGTLQHPVCKFFLTDFCG